MPLCLAEQPQRDRPRARFWALGPTALTAQELMAILLGTGCAGRDALTVAGELLGRVDGSLRRLAGRPLAELARLPGVGPGPGRPPAGAGRGPPARAGLSSRGGAGQGPPARRRPPSWGGAGAPWPGPTPGM